MNDPVQPSSTSAIDLLSSPVPVKQKAKKGKNPKPKVSMKPKRIRGESPLVHVMPEIIAQIIKPRLVEICTDYPVKSYGDISLLYAGKYNVKLSHETVKKWMAASGLKVERVMSIQGLSSPTPKPIDGGEEHFDLPALTNPIMATQPLIVDPDAGVPGGIPSRMQPATTLDGLKAQLGGIAITP